MASAADPGPLAGWRRFGPPLVAFGWSRLVMFAAGIRALRGSERAERWSFDAWAHWDSNHYLSIARIGYEMHPCGDVPDAPTWTWCGNAGWFPGYALVLRPFIRAGLPEIPVAVAVSGLFTYLVLHTLWTRWLADAPQQRGYLALAFAAVAPGIVFLHAVFPISLLLVLMLGALRALLDGRFLAAGLCGAAAAFTYPSGVLLAFVMVGHAVLVGGARTAKRLLREALLPAALTSAGLGAVLLVHHVAVGDAFAFFKIQGKYGHGLHWPHQVLLDRLLPLWSGGPLLPALQTLFVAVASLGILAALLLARRGSSPAERLVALHATIYWLVPLIVGGDASLHRADALLLPSVVWARRLPRPVLLGLVGAAAFMAVRVGGRFFQGALR